MRVEGPAGMLQALLGARAGRNAASATSAVIVPEPSSTAQPGKLVTAAPSVAMLVTIAAGAPEGQRRRDAVKSAGQGLGHLEALHAELVRGGVSPGRLRSLRDWARQRRQRPDDPELAALLDELEMRILVELAKLDR